MARCAGIKRDGGRCTVVVGPSQTHCYQHDPDRSEERRRNASRGGKSKSSGGELPDLKRQLKELAAGVLDGSVDRGAAAVVNQLLNTVVRVVEQQRKIRETEELAGRLEALEEVLKGRKARWARLLCTGRTIGSAPRRDSAWTSWRRREAI